MDFYDKYHTVFVWVYLFLNFLKVKFAILLYILLIVF
jgi:hypothetical protein